LNNSIFKDTQTFTMSMITAAQWVPRGFAAPFPQKYTLDEAEFERIAELAKLQLDDAQEDLEEAEEAAKNGAKSDKTENKEEDSEMKIDGDESAEKNEYAAPGQFSANSSTKTNRMAQD
jgi:periodic tryptophan protein 1